MVNTRRTRLFWVGAVALLVLGAISWWIAVQPSVRNKFGRSDEQSGSNQKQRTAQAARAHDSLNRAVADLNAATDAEKTRAILANLRKLLDSLPPDVASRVVQASLKSGKDAGTKLNVTIKPGGNLGDASSFRVFLLDYLGQIDRASAGNVAMTVLSRYTAPDEWAVSLRNFAWANPGAGSYAYLQQKTRELLANPQWSKDPSVGYLEAFDAIVYARATDLTPELTTLVRDKDNKATAHAAYLTMDRLTITNPVSMLSQLVDQPDLMKGREQTRANFVARADIRQPDQRSLVEQYLLDPHRSAAELNTFAGIYPNANYMISDNLLTEVKTPRADDLIVSDREALKVVEEWENDPRFEPILPVLDQIRGRLENFIKQADRGR